MRKLMALCSVLSLLAGLLCWAQVKVISCGGGAAGTITVSEVGTGCLANTNASTTGCTITATFAANTTYVVVGATYSGTSLSVSDSASQTWSTPANGTKATPSGGYVGIRYKQNSAALTSITCKANSGSTVSCMAIKLADSSGYATFAEAAPGGSATSMAPSSGNVTTSVANEVLIGGYTADDYTNPTGRGAFNQYGSTTIRYVNNGTAQPSFAQYKAIASSSTTTDSAMSWNDGNQGWAMVGASFKP